MVHAAPTPHHPGPHRRHPQRWVALVSPCRRHLTVSPPEVVRHWRGVEGGLLWLPPPTHRVGALDLEIPRVGVAGFIEAHAHLEKNIATLKGKMCGRRCPSRSQRPTILGAHLSATARERSVRGEHIGTRAHSSRPRAMGDCRSFGGGREGQNRRREGVKPAIARHVRRRHSSEERGELGRAPRGGRAEKGLCHRKVEVLERGGGREDSAAGRDNTRAARTSTSTLVPPTPLPQQRKTPTRTHAHTCIYMSIIYIYIYLYMCVVVCGENPQGKMKCKGRLGAPRPCTPPPSARYHEGRQRPRIGCVCVCLCVCACFDAMMRTIGSRAGVSLS